ncbi:MAG: rRNA (uracil1939-C5)-methyltransferase [Chloroflexia bacterium]|jgi:23S rRNA (uracil1939-C5)-methyltransferase|nr:rRNA (uracil1939-C5)-methyltransferase [Chloroflexia bacterium]
MRVTLTDMAHGGDAVGRDPDSGMAVFAWPGISGEEVEVEVNWRRPNLVRGLVTGIHSPSELRIEPPCPYFGACGGCQWQHVDYSGQVRFKHGILRSQLTRLGGVADPEAVMKAPIPSPRDYRYRNTSHFAIDGQARSLAYFRRNSHDLIAVDECPISNSGINDMIVRLNALLAQSPSSADLQMEPRGIMRVWKIVIRHSEATGQTVVIFHTRPGGTVTPQPPRGRQGRSQVQQRPDEGPNMDENLEASPVFPMRRRDVKRALPQLAALDGRSEQLALTIVEVMDDGTINLLGVTREAASETAEAVAETLTGAYIGDRGEGSDMGRTAPPLGAWLERLGGRNYWVAPDAFFQVNTGGAEAMLAEVLAALPSRVDLLVDAHAGVGTFALALAGQADKVVGYELAGSSVASARWTAQVGSISNAEFRQGPSERLFASLPDTMRPDAVVLDPPRSGCAPSLLREVLKREIPRIVYVSCEPGTLARDIKVLSSQYALTSTRVIDMFPQTYHIESVSVLERL